MRSNGNLSEDDIKHLWKMHDEALELAKECFHRLRIGNDRDQHARAWWRVADERIRDAAGKVASGLRSYDSLPVEKNS